MCVGKGGRCAIVYDMVDINDEVKTNLVHGCMCVRGGGGKYTI